MSSNTAAVDVKNSVFNAFAAFKEMLVGRPVEKISIEDLKRWETLIDAKIATHEAKATRHQKRANLIRVAGLIAALATGVVLGTFLGGIFFPLLFIAVPVAAFFLIKTVSHLTEAQEKASANQKTKSRELQIHKQAILKSEAVFTQFVNVNKGKSLTVDEFVQALYLFSKRAP
jgi:hypothetical protein